MFSRFTYALTAFVLSSGVACAYIAPGSAAGGAQTATPPAQAAPSGPGHIADISVGIGMNSGNIYDGTDYNPGYYGNNNYGYSDSNYPTQYEYDTDDYSQSYYADPQVHRYGPYYRPYHRYYRR